MKAGGVSMRAATGAPRRWWARPPGGRPTPDPVVAAPHAGVKKALKDVETTMAGFRPTPPTSAGSTFAEQFLEDGGVQAREAHTPAAGQLAKAAQDMSRPPG